MLADLFWMQKAYQLAVTAQSQGEVPVGAVLISAENQLLGEGFNQVISQHDPCAHAEIIAIQRAANTLGNYRLPNTTLYITLEPCCMCAGAILQARLARVVFATRDFKTGAVGSVVNLLGGYPFNHKVQIDEGIMQQQCAELLSGFFRLNRRQALI